MRGSVALSRGAEAVLAQQSSKCFAAERNTLAFHQLFAEMVIVEAGILGAGQAQDGLASALRQPAVAGPPATGVSQSRLPVFAHTLLQALNLAHAQAQESGGSGTRQLPLHTSGNNRHSLYLFLAQCKCLPVHRVTFS